MFDNDERGLSEKKGEKNSKMVDREERDLREKSERSKGMDRKVKEVGENRDTYMRKKGGKIEINR
jgi:hypothetical protein